MTRSAFVIRNSGTKERRGTDGLTHAERWHALHASWGCSATTDNSCAPCSAPSDRELCRRNGWGPGTVLEGDEGYGPERITLMYVGTEVTVAVADSDNREHSWTLSARLWRRVGFGD